MCKASAQLDPMMRDQFGERVCFNCKDGRDEYDLLCKADVMAEYLLPEGTIRVLRFVEKENPKKEGWNKMKLFLRKHVRSLPFALCHLPFAIVACLLVDRSIGGWLSHEPID